MYVLVNVFIILKFVFCSVYFCVLINFLVNCWWLIERLFFENDFFNLNENWFFVKFFKERLVWVFLISSKVIKWWDEEWRLINEVIFCNVIILNFVRFYWEKKNNIIWYVCDDFVDFFCNLDVNDKF